jgi:hypothetical protein
MNRKMPTNVSDGTGTNQGHFGPLGRNTLQEPAFYDYDFSLGERYAHRPHARCLVRWLVLVLIAGSVSMAQTSSALREPDSGPLAIKQGGER